MGKEVPTSEGAESDFLALSVHRREEGAFERLIERYEAPLFNFVYRLLLDKADAEEVVQDTFVRAHRAITSKYSERQCRELALRAWLFRIARNLTRNKRRQKRYELEQQLSDSEREIRPVSGLSIVCSVERKQELERLDRAILHLDDEARELILLRFIEEMSYGEIAETTGGSEASLRGKVFRALRALRDVLREEEINYAV